MRYKVTALYPSGALLATTVDARSREAAIALARDRYQPQISVTPLEDLPKEAK